MQITIPAITINIGPWEIAGIALFIYWLNYVRIVTKPENRWGFKNAGRNMWEVVFNPIEWLFYPILYFI